MAEPININTNNFNQVQLNTDERKPLVNAPKLDDSKVFRDKGDGVRLGAGNSNVRQAKASAQSSKEKYVVESKKLQRTIQGLKFVLENTEKGTKEFSNLKQALTVTNALLKAATKNGGQFTLPEKVKDKFVAIIEYAETTSDDGWETKEAMDQQIKKQKAAIIDLISFYNVPKKKLLDKDLPELKAINKEQGEKLITRLKAFQQRFAEGSLSESDIEALGEIEARLAKFKFAENTKTDTEVKENFSDMKLDVSTTLNQMKDSMVQGLENAEKLFQQKMNNAQQGSAEYETYKKNLKEIQALKDKYIKKNENGNVDISSLKDMLQAHKDLKKSFGLKDDEYKEFLNLAKIANDPNATEDEKKEAENKLSRMFFTEVIDKDGSDQLKKDLTNEKLFTEEELNKLLALTKRKQVFGSDLRKSLTLVFAKSSEAFRQHALERKLLSQQEVERFIGQEQNISSTNAVETPQERKQKARTIEIAKEALKSLKLMLNTNNPELAKLIESLGLSTANVSALINNLQPHELEEYLWNNTSDTKELEELIKSSPDSVPKFAINLLSKISNNPTINSNNFDTESLSLNIRSTKLSSKEPNNYWQQQQEFINSPGVVII